jgi:hypothetical protein
VTVANVRTERDAAIGKLAGLTRPQLLHELVLWAVTASEIADEARDFRARRAEARTMLELISGELRNRGAATPHEAPAAEGAS